jgi:hypothetical protein
MAHTTSLTTPASLDDLAWAISVDGIAAHLPAVRLVTAAARRCGVNPTLVAVLADATAPAVARERAFGLVAVALATSVPERTPSFAVAA